MRITGLALILLLLPVSAAAYRDDVLQQLTFLAAKRFNRCVEGTAIPRLTALQVRNLVRGNLAEADANVLRRATRWSYYDRSDQEDRRVLGFINTSMHERFEDRSARVLETSPLRDALRYEDLGTVIHYLQSVTIPADVVPIFHPRPWRWPSGDRFSNYPVDLEALTESVSDLCLEVLATPEDANFESILNRTAALTMAAIRSPISDMQASWHVFWEEDEPGRFGSYGIVGNSFGRAAHFPCGDAECHLLEDDPIYRDFALAQHRLAVLSTMRAVLVLQRFALARDNAIEIANDDGEGAAPD
ncbi:MAG: hypothetical protein V2I63_06500 [Pseudomonadales bacterium]|jgi:hypothetical protein|nr:hypothetical protein [Pseudomonadales bacterium]